MRKTSTQKVLCLQLPLTHSSKFGNHEKKTRPEKIFLYNRHISIFIRLESGQNCSIPNSFWLWKQWSCTKRSLKVIKNNWIAEIPSAEALEKLNGGISNLTRFWSINKRQEELSTLVADGHGKSVKDQCSWLLSTKGNPALDACWGCESNNGV